MVERICQKVGAPTLQTDRQTTDGTAIAYSEREREFTFAKNGNSCSAVRMKLGYLVVLLVVLLVYGNLQTKPECLVRTLRYSWPNMVFYA